MSLKAKIAAGAATFAMAGGGLGTVGTLSASAATPPCGTECVAISTLKFGPSFILETSQGTAATGQEVILSIASNGDPGEDFVANNLGLVRKLYTMGRQRLITAQFAKAYANDVAWEYEYAPLGVPSHLCASTWPGQVAQPGYEVRLEPCGEYSNSIWVSAPTETYNKLQYGVAINGATNNFSDPLVLTYPAGYPTDTPSPTVIVEPENAYVGGTVFDDQQWTYSTGTVNSNPPR